MKTENQTMLLRDAGIDPTNEVLEKALGKTVFGVYTELIAMATTEFDIEPQWRFYNDGKAWLCKAVNKKKTIFWLSVWEGSIKLSFFFTEKTRGGIAELAINKEIKDNFEKAEQTGKLVALILDITKKEQLKDVREIIGYKKKLK